MQKIKKRKRKHRIMNGITVFMCGMAFVATMLYAFHEPRLTYTLMFFGSMAWLMVQVGDVNV